MNGLALLVLAAAALGVDYGWQPTADGQLEYIIQVEPVTLIALRGGQEVVSQIDPYVSNVRRFRIHVGSEMVPRRGMPPQKPPAVTRAAPPPAGVQFGWQPIDAQQMEVVIQISPERVAALRNGEDIAGEMPLEAKNVTRLRIRTGAGQLPRQDLPAAPVAGPVVAPAPDTGTSERAGTNSPWAAGLAAAIPAAAAGGAASQLSAPAVAPQSASAPATAASSPSTQTPGLGADTRPRAPQFGAGPTAAGSDVTALQVNPPTTSPPRQPLTASDPRDTAAPAAAGDGSAYPSGSLRQPQPGPAPGEGTLADRFPLLTANDPRLGSALNSSLPAAANTTASAASAPAAGSTRLEPVGNPAAGPGVSAPNPLATPSSDPRYAPGPADPGYALTPGANDPRYAPGPTANDPRYANVPPANDPRYAAVPPADDPRYAAVPPANDPRYANVPPANDPRYAAVPPANDPRYTGVGTSIDPRYATAQPGYPLASTDPRAAAWPPPAAANPPSNYLPPRMEVPSAYPPPPGYPPSDYGRDDPRYTSPYASSAGAPVAGSSWAGGSLGPPTGSAGFGDSLAGDANSASPPASAWYDSTGLGDANGHYGVPRLAALSQPGAVAPRANPAQDFWSSLAGASRDSSLAFLRESGTMTSQADAPRWSLALAVFALFVSLGGNLYLGWIALGIYQRYLDLADELVEPGPRRRRDRDPEDRDWDRNDRGRDRDRDLDRDEDNEETGSESRRRRRARSSLAA